MKALLAKRPPCPNLPLPDLELPPELPPALEVLPALTVLLLPEVLPPALEPVPAAATDVAAAEALTTELAAPLPAELALPLPAAAEPLSLTRNLVQSSCEPRWATGMRTGW